MFAGELTPVGVGAILAAVLIGLILLRMAVPFALLTVSLLGFLLFMPPEQLSAVGPITWESVNKPLLAGVPLFVLMGELFARSSLSPRTYDALSPLVSRIPGGLWHSNVAASGLFAAASGSSVGTTAAIGPMAIPQLNARGYPKHLTYGSLAAGGTLGILIPPSLAMIIFGITTGTSIGDLFIAGIVPGIVLAGLFSAYLAGWALWRRDRMPDRVKPPLLAAFRALLGVAPLLLLVLLVLGSLYLGIATPTESAAVGIAGLVILTLVYGPRSGRAYLHALRRTVGVSVMVLLILIGGHLFAYVVSYAGIPATVTDAFTGSGANPYLLMALIIVVLLLLGMFLDPISIVVLTVPLLLPTVLAFGFDPVWFGVFVVIAIEAGLITPPVGLNLFIIKSVDREARFGAIAGGAVPFVAMMIVLLALLLAAPEVALWLPGQRG